MRAGRGSGAEPYRWIEPLTTACCAVGRGYGGLLTWCIVATPDQAKETRIAPTKIAGIQDRFMSSSSSELLA